MPQLLEAQPDEFGQQVATRRKYLQTAMAHNDPIPEPEVPKATTVAPVSASVNPQPAAAGHVNPLEVPAAVQQQPQGTAGPAPAAGQGPAPAAGGATFGSIQDAFRNALQGLLTGPSPAEVGAQAGSSPIARAFRTAQARAEARQREQAAHSNALTGAQGNSPQLEMAIRGLGQRRGEAEAGFVGELAERQQDARRQELMQALQLALSMGDNDAARAIQLRIAEMDSQLRRDLSADDLGFRYADLQQRANSDALRYLFG